MLDGSINESNFESFKQGDIYALGLVFWEVAYRVESTSLGYQVSSHEYVGEIRCDVQPPYWDLVGVDPSLDQMRKVVCLDLMRPELPPGWEQTEPTRSLAR